MSQQRCTARLPDKARCAQERYECEGLTFDPPKATSIKVSLLGQGFDSTPGPNWASVRERPRSWLLYCKLVN
jgi:hypothetical protein